MAEDIVYVQKLIISMEESLRSAFHQPYLRLTRRPERNSPAFVVELEDESRHAQADDGREQRVMEILAASGESTSFYFGFVGQFEIGGITHKHVLQHASLIVFHEICAGELTSLFRAEWDEKAALDPQSQHAQPHWHFVQSPGRIEGIVRNVMGSENTFIPEQRSELFVGPDCGKFHFAMAPLWDKTKKPSYKHTFEADDFQKWFAELTEYIAGQIAHLVRHTPPQKEFTASTP